MSSYKPLLTTFLLISSVVVSLPGMGESKKHESVFAVSTSVPKEFKSLAKERKLLVDVYFEGKLLGVLRAKLGVGKIKIYHPETVLYKIKGLKDRSKIQNVMSHTLSTNARYICRQQHHCPIYVPKVAGVVYDQSQFKATIFINPKYRLVKPLGPQWLPQSTSDWSYLNHLFFSASHSGVDNQPDAQSTIYNLTSNNVLSYKNLHVNVSLSYGNDISGSTALHLNDANIGFDHRHLSYHFGLIEMPGSIFYSNHAILGASFASTLKTLTNNDQFFSTPLEIYLAFPAQVSVFASGKLIYSARYPAGKQRLNTRSFPSGTYPIQIQTIDINGTKQLIDRIFVNSHLIPPWHMPQYSASVGYLMGIRNNQSDVYSELLPIPVYSASYQRRLGGHAGLSLSLLGSNKAAFGNVGLAYIGHGWSFQPGVLVGSNSSLGYTAMLNLHKSIWFYQANLTQLLYTNQADENLAAQCNSGNKDACAYALVTQPDLTANMSLGMNFSHVSFNIYGNLSESSGTNTQYTYGARLNWILKHLRRGNLSLSLDVAKGTSEYSILANLVYQFSKPHLSGSLQGGYASIKDIGSNDYRGTGGAGGANLLWSRTDSTGLGYSLGANVDDNPVVTSVGLNGQYDNHFMNFSGYVSRNFNKRDVNTTQYGGTFDSRIIWTPSGGFVGRGGIGNDTGISVVVHSKDPSSTFDVLVDGNVRDHVKANQHAFIPLSPYEAWNIQVVNTSQALYQFHRVRKNVILYPGNVQELHWKAVKKVVVAGKVINHAGHPIKNAVVDGVLGFGQTDDEGYLQGSVYTDQRSLSVHDGQHRCYVNLPSFKHKKSVYYLHHWVCVDRGFEKGDSK